MSRRSAAGAAASAWTCGAAWAHEPGGDPGSFVSGLIHPFVTPAQLLGLVALGLLLGQTRSLGRTPTRSLGITLSGFTGAAMGGMLAIAAGAFALPPFALLGLGLATGVLVAAAPPLPGWAPRLIGMAVGLGIGLDSGHGSSPPGTALITYTGILVGSVISVIGILAITSLARRPWQHITLRVLGSWTAACAGLVLSVSLLPDPASSPDRRTVNSNARTLVATSYPLAYFARRLAGSGVSVILPMIPAHKHFWQPTPEDLRAMNDAAFVLTDIRHADHWLDHLERAMGHVIDTTAGARPAPPQAPNPWLNQSLALKQAAAVRDALAQAQLVDGPLLQSRWRALEEDLLALDEALHEATRPLQGVALLVAGDAYAHLAARYGLDAWGFEWDPSTPINDGVLRGLANLLRVHPARWMLWNRVPHEQNIARLEAMGVQSLVFDPLAVAPIDGDYLAIMRRSIDILARASQ